MTAIEALIYCLGFINETPEDEEYQSQFVHDRYGDKHWIAWDAKDFNRASPTFCSESPEGCFTRHLEPYRC